MKLFDAFRAEEAHVSLSHWLQICVATFSGRSGAGRRLNNRKPSLNLLKIKIRKVSPYWRAGPISAISLNVSSAITFSALLRASLMAAMIMSSITSASSRLDERGSIFSFFSSCLPETTQVTRPLPAAPGISMAFDALLHLFHFLLELAGLLHHLGKVCHSLILRIYMCVWKL